MGVLEQLTRTAVFFKELWTKPLARQLVIGGATFVLIAIILLSNFLVAKVDLKVGQVAPREIVAPRTIVDKPQTELLEQEAARRAVREAEEDEDNYVISQTVALQAETKLEEFFSKIEGVQEAGAEQEKTDLGDEYEFSRETIAVLAGLSRSRLNQLRRIAKTTLADLMQKERISEEKLPEYKQKATELLAKAQLKADEEQALQEVTAGFLQPNLILDPQKVEQARQAAIRSVEPVMVLKDQVIIRRGDKVTEEHIQILRDLGMQRRQLNYLAILGVLILTSLLILFLAGYLYQYRRDVLREEKLLYLFALIVCTQVALTKLVSSIAGTGAGFLIPTAFATMLIAILLDLRLGVVAAVIFSLIAGIVADNNIRVLVVNLVGGIAGAFCVSKISQRSDITRAGFLVGLANFFAILGMGMLAGDLSMLKLSWLGLLNGIISAILTIGTLPYLETIFHLTSAIRLLELANPNHPLLRRLLVEAPGTYHHSLLVGNLAEAAIEEVGGDSVLVRVGAYYHDIGKIKRPYFFTENQFGMENPHDKIAPGLSTLIITSHVKDGVELAREHKLPEPIIDLIKQHHGTDLVKYFYSRAQENDREKVSEKDFQYQGPKPQTKEAAVLMLADSVEAAVRSLREPSPGRIEGVVRKIIKERLASGLLDESELTFRDLDKIGTSFVRTLSGIYHQRVEYPQLKAGAKA